MGAAASGWGITQTAACVGCFLIRLMSFFGCWWQSHAVLNWVEENADRCDVIHGHEWGGAFVDLITANHYRQARCRAYFTCCAIAVASHACFRLLPESHVPKGL